MGGLGGVVAPWQVSLAAMAIGLAPVSANAQNSVVAPQTGTVPARTDDGISEIVVTAQKRQQSVNDVPITITAATGDALKLRGITEVADLPRLVPGFTVAQSAFNSTSFTLRGVGFFNSDLATPPAVSVYVDEAPLPYPAMTKLAAFDLERVEVLKGPQGILYGQNATAGAVNYIAAKPTDQFDAGLDLGYGRFSRFQGSGFVSGPLSNTLSARIALQGRTGDGWQKSTTRPDDRLGAIREFQGRATLNWRPFDRFKSRLTLTITHDGSDSLAAQLLQVSPTTPALALPALFTFPIVQTPRAADWTPDLKYRSDSNLYNVNWRNDLEVANGVVLTSLTAYSHYKQRYAQDTDGTPLRLLNVVDARGRVNSIFQELRLAGQSTRFNWLIGANYDHDTISDAQFPVFDQQDGCFRFKARDPQAFCTSDTNVGHTVVDTYGIFGRADFKLSDTFGIEAGIRYNNDKRVYDGCVIVGSENHARFFNIFQGIFNGGLPIVPLHTGDCQVLDPLNKFKPVPNVHALLHQDNISWRAGVNWKVQPETLLYFNVSRGYKAGTVPVVGAATTSQYTPVGQESVTAYEGGIKASLFDRHVQFNAAAFYYDYKDKQLRGAYLDPFLRSVLEALVTIPKSHVVGAEAQIIAQPVTGLVLNSSLTYVKTRIDNFSGYNALGVFANQKGTPFPFSPKWQSVSDLSYKFPVSNALDAFLGGALTYNSKTYSGVGGRSINLLYINSFAYVDLRGGVETQNGRYRLSVWGKNVTNKYHWNSAYVSFTTRTRFVSSPATYGVTLSYRFR